eukprot:3790078-Pleurochrysis_carterae.AAC.1
MTCSHTSHKQQVGGNCESNGWSSASHAAYPPDLNLLIAKSIAAHTSSVHSLNTAPQPDALQRFRDATNPDSVSTQPRP